MPDKLSAPRRLRVLGWLGLFLLAAFAFAWVAIPVFKIQPFASQTTEALKLSYTLRVWSPLLTIGVLVIALALTVWLWRSSHRWWSRALLILPLVTLLFVTWFARQNHFEWMFAPLPNDDYALAANVDFIGNEEMVMAIKVGDDAVAFPVRQIAYHHLIQETVGDTHVVATY